MHFKSLSNRVEENSRYPGHAMYGHKTVNYIRWTQLVSTLVHSGRAIGSHAPIFTHVFDG